MANQKNASLIKTKNSNLLGTRFWDALNKTNPDLASKVPHLKYSGNQNIYKPISTEGNGILKSAVSPLYKPLSQEQKKLPTVDLEAMRQKYKEIATAGKTPANDYLYSLGETSRISQEAIDNLIGWNNDTGEVTFDGKSVGKPSVSIDGVAYLDDTAGLDNAFNDYVTRQKSIQTPTRDYLYSLGETNGMTKEEVDKLIGWNNDTGEVIFDGKVVGKPDMGVDGVSYWNDTSRLDKAFNDYLSRQAKTGKTATRDYLYSLGAGRGMSKEEIDSLIGWDNDTGEVTFGGKKIGKPDLAYDGVSYWNDTSVLDNAFNDWVKRSGHTMDGDLIRKQYETGIKDNTDQLVRTEFDDKESMKGKYNKLEDTAYSNPFESDVAKAILGKYDLAALQGRDNAVASGSATNGGNIDSFAAANAMRQQAALTNQGQMAVLEAHNQKLNNIKGILESLGVYQQNQDKNIRDTIGLQQTESQRLFENDETVKNNTFNREETAKKNRADILAMQADITGITPTEWVNDNNPYLNADGTIKEQYKNVDFATVMKNAKASGDTAGYNAAATARFYKIMNDYATYGMYDDGNYKAPTEQKTEAGKNNEATRQEIYSGISGNVGDAVTKSQYTNIWNADGTLKNYDQDFAGAMDVLKKLQEAAPDQATKDRLADQLRILEMARNQKIDDLGLSYPKSYTYANAPRTADYDLNMAQMDNALKMAQISSATSLEIAAADNASKEKIAEMNNQSKETIQQMKNDNSSSSGSGSSSSSSSSSSSKSGDSKTTAPLTDAQVKSWAETLNSAVAKEFGPTYTQAVKLKENGEYERVIPDADFIIKRVLSSNDLTDEQASYLLSRFGITEDQINNAKNDKHYQTQSK